MLEIWRDPSLPTNTFVMVSHNVEEAVYMADRVLVMSPRPERVISEVKVNLSHSCTKYLRDPKYFQSVDEVVAILKKSKREDQVKSQIG